MDKAAQEANSKALTFWIGGAPTIIAFALFVPLMFIGLYLGAPVISDFMNSISNGPILHILSTVGGGLAALGIAVTMHVIGNRSLVVFFFLAYFLAIVTKTAGVNITTVTWAVFGVIIAVVYSQLISKKEKA